MGDSQMDEMAEFLVCTECRNIYTSGNRNKRRESFMCDSCRSDLAKAEEYQRRWESRYGGGTVYA